MTQDDFHFQTNSPEETIKLGEFLGDLLIKLDAKKATIVALNGVLGAGKTELVKGLAKFLGVKEKILSPTFVLAKEFKCYKKPFKQVWHLDLYRFDKYTDLKTLDWQDITKDKDNLILVEWADKFKELLADYEVLLKVAGEQKRDITIKKVTNAK